MVQPINYLQNVQDPFKQAVQGLQLGAGIADIYAQREVADQQNIQNALAQAQQQQYQAGINSFFATPPAERKYENLERLFIGANKQQFDALQAVGKNMTEEKLATSKRFTGQVLAALESNPESAKQLLMQRIEAETDPMQKKAWQDTLKLAEVSPDQAIKNVELVGGAAFGKDWYETIANVRKSRREQALEPSVLAEAVAKAKKAVAEADDTPSRLAAEQELRVAQAAQQRALTAASVGGEARAEALAPSVLAEAVAKADSAVADAERKVAEAKDTPARLEAEQNLRLRQAEKESALTAASVGGESRAVAKAPSELIEAKAKANAALVTANFAERIAQAGLNKTNWDVKNLQSQVSDRSARLNLDTQKTAADVADKMSSIQTRLTEIPPEARKLINESATLASTSKQAAVQFNDLAKRIESAEGGKGALTSATEWFAKASGRQDEWTQIRNEYTRVRNTVAIKSLPPGVATDKDIELALKGIPPETANSATLGSFLRGMAKLQDIDSSINDAKTDWLSQNNGLLTRAKNTFVAGDYATKPGETFNDFAQRIVGDVSQKYRSPEQIAEQRRQESIGRIPTTAAPAAAPAAPGNIRAQADAILRGGK
jgi:3-deoxy-D-manno-octulosonate 8-phosphate phosphatase KdsC-like HAD superfamily phosphatase